MNIEDLEYVFQSQLEKIEKDGKLFYMLVDSLDSNSMSLHSHPANDLEGLLPMLDCFQYAGPQYNVPKFVK